MLINSFSPVEMKTTSAVAAEQAGAFAGSQFFFNITQDEYHEKKISNTSGLSETIYH